MVICKKYENKKYQICKKKILLLFKELLAGFTTLNLQHKSANDFCQKNHSKIFIERILF